jgi:hypothetical protein
MQPFRPSLILSILAFLSCLLLMAWLLFSLFAFRTAANDLYAQKGDHARMLLATFVSQLPDIIPAYPVGMLPSNSPAGVFAQKLAEDESFIRLTLLDVNNKVIYTAGRDNMDAYHPFTGLSDTVTGSFVLPDGKGFVCISPVVRNGAVVAKAGLALSLESEKSRLERSQGTL